MFFNHFLKFLTQYSHIDQSIAQALRYRVSGNSFIKRQIILKPDQICKCIYYVHKGFLRVYQHTEAGERTVDFAKAGELITVPASFFGQQTSDTGIICEADAYLYALSYYDLRALEEQLDGFLSLSNKVTTAILISYSNDLNFYRAASAPARYLYLLKSYPQITNVVAQKDIATYLGMAQQTLSRLVRDYIR